MVSGKAKKETLVRIGYLGDHPEVIRLVASWIYREWSLLYRGKSRQYVEGFLRERLHKRKLPITLVAFDKDTPVGTVSIKEYEMEQRPDLPDWITSLYVVPGWRKKGIGASLMIAAAEQAARLGIPRLFLFTADPDLAAVFYSRLGWKIKEHDLEKGYPVIIMEKDLQVLDRENA